MGVSVRMSNSEHSKSTHPVFYSRKVLDNSSIIETTVWKEPTVTDKNEYMTYCFRIDLVFGDRKTSSEVHDVTSVRETAERLFDLLTTGVVFPCHLSEVAEDFLTA